MNRALSNHERDIPGKRTPFKFANGVRFLLDDNDLPVVLGSGAFGRVYVAIQDGQLRALKVLNISVVFEFNSHLTQGIYKFRFTKFKSF